MKKVWRSCHLPEPQQMSPRRKKTERLVEKLSPRSSVCYPCTERSTHGRDPTLSRIWCMYLNTVHTTDTPLLRLDCPYTTHNSNRCHDPWIIGFSRTSACIGTFTLLGVLNKDKSAKNRTWHIKQLLVCMVENEPIISRRICVSGGCARPLTPIQRSRV